MKTVDEIIEYLQFELAEAHELHDQAQGQERLYYAMKAAFVAQLLEEIKK